MGVVEETKMVKRFFLFGVMPIILFLFFLGKLTLKKSQLEEDIQTKKNRIKHYYETGFDMPSQEIIKKKKTELAEAEETLGSVRGYSRATLPDLPGDVSEPGVYFKEKLYLSQKEWEGFAKEKNVELPGNFGFDEKLPDRKSVSLLLLKLETVDKVIKILIENKVQAIRLIEFLEPEILRGVKEEKLPARGLSIKIEADCAYEVLKKTLYEIGNLQPFVAVQALKIKQTQAEKLEVVFQVTQLFWEKKDEGKSK